MAVTKSASNGQFVNFTGGDCRVTIIGEDMSGHKLDLYSALISVPEQGISLPIDNTIGRVKEKNRIFNGRGSLAGTTPGNEQIIDKDGSLNFTQDFVYLSATPKGVAVSRDVLRNMLKAEVFTAEVDGAEKTIKPAGTNGTTKRAARTTNRGIAFEKMFEQDGRLVVPQSTDDEGNLTFESNSEIETMSTTALTVMLEFLYEYDENNAEGYRFAYALTSNENWSEDSEANTIAMDVTYPCDVRYIDKWFIEGPSTGWEDINDEVYYLVPDYVADYTAPLAVDTGILTDTDATTPIDITPPANAAEGDYVVVYDTDTNTYILTMVETGGTTLKVLNSSLATDGTALDSTEPATIAEAQYKCYDFKFSLSGDNAVFQDIATV